ncbi:hypothetical protein GCM10011338_34310 [Alteromonas lipolytica]|nr:hypothetical protein GCM10011338_34310 [Alteromonas lipolytica]
MLVVLIALPPAGAQTLADNIDLITDNRDFSESIPRQHKLDPIIDAHLVLFKHMSLVFKPILLPTLKVEPRLKQTKPACTFGRLKTAERAKAFIFSLPTEFFLAHQLYQNTATGPVDRTLLNADGEITHLGSLFDFYRGRKLILLKGRSYGELLDEQIRALPDAVKYFRSGNDMYTEDIAMLEKARGDYILSLPYNVFKTQHKDKHGEFLSYPIAGNTRYNAGHVMCNDTPETRDFINQVNTALKEVYATPEFEQAHTDYTDPASYERIKMVLNELKSLANAQ